MAKKCLICDGTAEFYIKGTSDYYCGACAYDQFGDLAYLLKVEHEIQELKEALSASPQDEEHINITINGKK